MTPMEARLVLSDMEFSAARLKRNGYKSSDIARKLDISEDAARKYVLRAKKKLGKYYHNSPVFEGLGESSLNHPNNIKTRCGRELLRQNIQNGYTRMAYLRYGKDQAYLNEEARLAYAINGFGDWKYLMRKRAEILRTMAAPAGCRVIRLESHMLSGDVMDVINHCQIKLLRTDLPGALEGETSVKHYLCKTEADYLRLIKVIIGRPEIKHFKQSGNVEISFPKTVYIEHLRILYSGEGYKELIAHEKQYQSSSYFRLYTPDLQVGKTYLLVIQINGGSQLEYSFTA